MYLLIAKLPSDMKKAALAQPFPLTPTSHNFVSYKTVNKKSAVSSAFALPVF